MKTILIIEDEMLIALDLKNRLEREGYDVLPIAPSAEKAIEAAKNRKVDLLIVDIVIKGIRDGIEAACEILKSRAVPILFITGNEHSIDRERLKCIPRYRILGKPPFEPEVMESILELLRA